MDITDTLAPKSDQLDAIELAGGPRIFTIEKVTRGSDEQPINVHFVDFPRPWRPSKGMRRVLAACWGTDSSVWPGRKVELFLDPEVTFGNEKPGGTRIRALSHIDKPRTIPLLVKRGRSAQFTVQPLDDGPEPLSKAQSDRLFALFTEHGLDKDAALDLCSQETGRTIRSTKALSSDEADRIIAALDTAEGGES